MIRPILFSAAVVALAACGGGSSSPQSLSGGTPPAASQPNDQTPPADTRSATLRILSNRADLVSADDVLVEVVANSNAAATGVVLTRNGDNVTRVLEATSDNPLRLLGTVTGLSLGTNTIAVNFGNAVTVTNHPNSGPVFTGPHIQPWQCQDSAENSTTCDQAASYSLLYKSTNPDSPGLQSYDPDNPPTDVADTTTDNGETLPFIVRREDGFMARDRYSFFTLQKLDENQAPESWTPANPQSQWNRRLLVTHGGNCRGDHNTSNPRVADYAGTIPENPGIESSYVTALGLGWSTMSTAQLNLGHNCNVSYQAESLMMAKERFIEQYGELRYTVGTGCSGGAITQNMIANAYPGLYQGILTTCTYPDVMSTATQFADYHILLRYFDFSADTPEQPDDFDSFMTAVSNLATTAAGTSTARDGTPFTVAQQNSIYGHENGIVNASLADSALFSEAVDPQSRCGGVTDEQRYHPVDNPTGTRCDVLTFMKNMVGAREQFDDDGNNRWSDNETAQGEGFAGYPLGNEGVQYGLTALNNPEASKLITREQFVAINKNIGGLDADLQVTTERLRPDEPSLTNAFRVGILNTGVNMDTVPIINMTGPDPGIAHDSVHGYWLRERLVREFGDRDNFVHWGGSAPLIGNANYMNDSLIAMAGWLDAIEQDSSSNPIAQKIVDNKPTDLVDRCEEAQGSMCPDEAMLVYGTPRTVAGNNTRFGDMVQCQLKPLDRSEYEPASMAWTDEQWAEVEALFPTGVCDYSKKPLGWTATIPWLTYQDELGDIITGGRQMQPAAFPLGWASPAFNQTWEPGWQTTTR